jgi:hypothetical protein
MSNMTRQLNGPGDNSLEIDFSNETLNQVHESSVNSPPNPSAAKARNLDPNLNLGPAFQSNDASPSAFSAPVSTPAVGQVNHTSELTLPPRYSNQGVLEVMNKVVELANKQCKGPYLAVMKALEEGDQTAYANAITELRKEVQIARERIISTASTQLTQLDGHIGESARNYLEFWKNGFWEEISNAAGKFKSEHGILTLENWKNANYRHAFEESLTGLHATIKSRLDTLNRALGTDDEQHSNTDETSYQQSTTTSGSFASHNVAIPKADPEAEVLIRILRKNIEGISNRLCKKYPLRINQITQVLAENFEEIQETIFEDARNINEEILIEHLKDLEDSLDSTLGQAGNRTGS